MEVAGTLWLHKADRKFLGSDRIALLEKIREYGSITKAAKAVGLSYKTAWDMVNHLNNMADRPLVERTAGGKGEGVPASPGRGPSSSSSSASSKRSIVDFSTPFRSGSSTATASTHS